ncbi:unnamed protein product, partial [Iphiclides podalirius]
MRGKREGEEPRVVAGSGGSFKAKQWRCSRRIANIGEYEGPRALREKWTGSEAGNTTKFLREIPARRPRNFRAIPLPTSVAAATKARTVPPTANGFPIIARLGRAVNATGSRAEPADKRHPSTHPPPTLSTLLAPIRDEGGGFIDASTTREHTVQVSADKASARLCHVCRARAESGGQLNGNAAGEAMGREARVGNKGPVALSGERNILGVMAKRLGDYEEEYEGGMGFCWAGAYNSERIIK